MLSSNSLVLGIIISTAFVHLMTHAQLMWSNSCLKIKYEGTGASITMAGIFIAFIIEYIALRIVNARDTGRLIKGN